MSGVFWDALGAATVLPCLVSSGIVDCRQTIWRSLTLLASI